MQPGSLQDISQRVLALNSDEQPFEYSVQGNVITGYWKIADVKWSNIIAGGDIDKEYRLTVELDEATHQYSLHEQKQNKNSNFSLGLNNISFETDSSGFSGKMSGKQWGSGIALKTEQNGQPGGHTYQYSFDTAKIKDPLLQTLEAAGWKQKGGFLSKLFKH